MTEQTTIWSMVKAEFLIAFVALAGLLAIGTVTYHFLEDWSWVSSFYFTVSTITTVGYGDLYPTTDLSRIFTAIFALAGVAVALVALGAIGAKYINKLQELAEKLGR